MVLPLLAALLVMALLMAGVWGVAVRIRNAGIVDVAWSFGFTPLATLFAALGPGYGPRRLLIAGMTALWSLRLALYLGRRIHRAHPVEDGRYQRLREVWTPHADRRFFWFFQLQGVLCVALSLLMLLPTFNPELRIVALEWLAVALWASSLLGESVADFQLDRFRKDAANADRTCQVGLWRYSRHPNYFFEWLVWVAYFLFALASPRGLVTLYCPLLMLYFLFRVTGIPATEAQALRSRGDPYRRYQQTTSVFVPWFRRA